MTAANLPKVFLFGFGKYGRHFYKHLCEAGYSVTVATQLKENYLAAVEADIEDVKSFNPKDNESLKALGIEPAKSMLYCTMDNVANNLFLILSLREIFHDATIVATSNSEENSRKMLYAGADVIIDVYDASAQHIVTNLTKPAVNKALNTIVYAKNDLRIAELTIEPHSLLEGRYANEIDFKARGVILIAIIDKELGDELVYLTRGVNHRLDAGDTLVLAGTVTAIARFHEEMVPHLIDEKKKEHKKKRSELP